MTHSHMMRTARLSLALLAFFTLPALTSQDGNQRAVSSIQSQPADERRAQDALPKSKDTLWAVLGKTKISVNEKKGIYLATFPDEVKKLSGQTVKISGFMLPLESNEKFTHFLLSKRTPTCPFCPPGEPNEIVEVYAAHPVTYDENLATYEGKFELANEQEAGIFFKITGAAKK